MTAGNSASQVPAATSAEGAGPGDGGKRLGEGGDARGNLAAAELAAFRLHAEAELDRGRGAGRDQDAGAGHQRRAQRGESERGNQRREDQRDGAHHRFDLGPEDAARR